jgi:hypothetical protein
MDSLVVMLAKSRLQNLSPPLLARACIFAATRVAASTIHSTVLVEILSIRLPHLLSRTHLLSRPLTPGPCSTATITTRMVTIMNCRCVPSFLTLFYPDFSASMKICDQSQSRCHAMPTQPSLHAILSAVHISVSHSFNKFYLCCTAIICCKCGDLLEPYQALQSGMIMYSERNEVTW